jgi:hypothetical protein
VLEDNDVAGIDLEPCERSLARLGDKALSDAGVLHSPEHELQVVRIVVYNENDDRTRVILTFDGEFPLIY